jgi:hypothetical protein
LRYGSIRKWTARTSGYGHRFLACQFLAPLTLKVGLFTPQRDIDCRLQFARGPVTAPL